MGFVGHELGGVIKDDFAGQGFERGGCPGQQRVVDEQERLGRVAAQRLNQLVQLVGG